MPRAIVAPDPIDLFVGQRIREERTEKNLSQGDLGQAVGVSFQQIQKYERGSNRVSASTLARLAAVLDVPIEDMFPPADAARDEPAQPLLGAIRGGRALAQHFAAMKPAQRLILLQVARTFARQPE